MDEAVSHYAAYPEPSTLERFIPAFFEDWLMRTRQLEKEAHAQKEREEGPIRPFGESTHDLETEWLEWVDYVAALNEGRDPAPTDEAAKSDDDDED